MNLRPPVFPEIDFLDCTINNASGMSDRHTNWKCLDCKYVIRAKVTPLKCPQCEHTVLEPTDDPPSDSHEGSVTTEEFDVDDALDNL